MANPFLLLNRRVFSPGLPQFNVSFLASFQLKYYPFFRNTKPLASMILSLTRMLMPSASRVLVLFIFVASAQLKAQTTYDWLNTAPDGNFRQGAFGARWNPGGLFDEPPYGIVQFNNNNQITMTNNVPGTWSQHKINFGTAATTGRTIGGNPIQFFDFGGTWPFIRNESSALHTLNFNLLVGTGGTWAGLELVNTGGNLTFGGTINNQGKNLYIYGNNVAVDGTNRSTRFNGVVSGAGFVNVSQFGVLKLNAANTYTGQTQIDLGELWIESTGSIAAGSGIFVGNGAQLGNLAKLWLSNATGGTTFTNSFTINNGNATTREIGGLNTSGTHTFSGNITNNSTTGGLLLSTINAGGSVNFSGVLSGGGAYTTQGAGTIIFSGASANTYTGLTSVNAGTLVLNKTAGVTAIPTNTTIAAGATIRTDAANQWGTGTPPLVTINGNGILNLNNNNQRIALASASATASVTLGIATLEINNSFTDTYAGVISGAGGLTKSNTGTQILSGANSYTGITNVNGGSLTCGAANTLPAPTNLTLANIAGAVVNLNDWPQTVGGLTGGGTTGGNVILGTAALTCNQIINTTYSGQISGAGSVVKLGSGILTLAGSNTYTGPTIATAGTLRLGAANVISDFSNVFLNGGTFSTGAAAGFSETAGILNLNGNSTIALGTGAHTLTFANSGAASWSGFLFVTGWTGAFNGTAGTSGRLFFGNTAAGITTDQRVRILFLNGSVYHTALILPTGEVVPTAQVAMFWNGTTVASWTAPNAWSLNPTGPYNQTWVTGRAAYFNLATNNITGATTNVSEIVAFESVTVTASGTLGFGPAGGGIAPIYVAGGRTFNFQSQALSTAAGTGIIKNGVGNLLSANPNASSLPAGVTLNAGLLGWGGVNGFGNGTLTLNGGVLSAAAATAISPNTSSIIVNANFQLGDFTNYPAGSGNLTFAANVDLGAGATRTITLGRASSYNFNGIISGAASNLVLNALAAGTLGIGGANTYGGNTTINGGTLLTTINNTLPSSTSLTIANAPGATLTIGATTQTIASLSGGGATGGSIVTVAGGSLIVNQNTNTTWNGVMSGAGNLTKNGTGTLLVTRPNTYSGITTIGGGVLELGAANVFGTGLFALSGGTLRTGSGAGFTESVGNLRLLANSTIALGTGIHTLSFGASDGEIWTGAATLTITGWTGPAGGSGTSGRIIVGSNSTHLTATQLAQINFSGYPPGATMLATGEVVPVGQTYVWLATSGSADWTLPGSWSPARNTPSTTDILSFPNGGSSIATNVPVETISKFVMSNNTTLALEAAASGNALTIAGGTGIDLDIPSGCSLTIGNAANAMSLGFSGTAHTANIAGTLTTNVSNTANTFTTTNSTTTVAAGGSLVSGGTLAGPITNNGSINFTRGGATYSYAGIISGTGTVTQSGAATLQLTGNNTYTGITTINAGSTLSLGSGGANGAISNSSNVTNNGALIVNRSTTYTYGGVISGTGTLNTQGNVTFQLTGTNTFTGSITISSPSIFSIGNGGATGEISNSANIINNSQLYINRTGTYIYGGAISGGGSISQFSGTFILTGANTYFGGVSQGGIWSVGNGGTTGSISPTAGFSGNGTVRFNRSNAVTYNGVISGVATLEKSGAGTLTFGGVGFYGGPTIINQGILELSGANLLPSTPVNLNGGTYSTGATVGFAETVGTLSLTANSGINLGTGNHSLTFANSSAVSWTAATTLTITGWTGTAGSSGTNGKIFVGVGGLTTVQLAQVSFNGFPSGALILPTGELVPPGAFVWNGSQPGGAWTNSLNWTPNGVPGSTDNVIIPGTVGYTNALNVTGSVTVGGFTIQSNGAFSLAAGSTLTITGVFSSTTTGTPVFDCSSTFNLSSTSSQTVPAWNFGNLNISGGPRVLAATGTIGVCGNYTSTAAALTTTGSTVDFNGTTLQTILTNTANFRNLILSNTTADVVMSVGVNVNSNLNINAGVNCRLVVPASVTLDLLGSTGNIINGNLRNAGIINNTSAANTTFGATGVYEHNYTTTGGIVPTATWSAGSTCKFIGYTLNTATPGGIGQSFHHFEWNCPSQTGGINLAGNLTTVNGNFTLTSTGTAELRLSGATSPAVNIGGIFNMNGGTLVGTNGAGNPAMNVSGNTFLNSGTINMSSGSGSLTLNLLGNLTIAGTSITESSTGSGTIRFQAASGTQDLTQSAGSITNLINFQVGNGSSNTLRFLTDFNAGTLASAEFTVNGNASVNFQNFALSGAGTFTSASGSTLISANNDPLGTFMTSGLNGSILSSSTRTYSAGTNFTLNGTLAQFTGDGIGVNAVGNLTISNTSGANPAVTLTNPVSVSNTLTLSNGILRLNTHAITITNNAAAAIIGGSVSAFVQTNSTGELRRAISTAGLPIAYNYPVGTGSDYTPVSYSFSANSTARNLHVRAVSGTHPNNASPAHFIANRFWTSDLSTAAGTYAYTASYTFITGDLNGTISNIALDRWDGTSWTQMTGSSAAGNVISSGSRNQTDGSLLGTAEWAGRTLSAAPIITSYSPLSAYTGEIITINGTNLSGLTSVTIGGVAATILTQTGTSATVAVNAGLSGTLIASNAGGTGSAAAAFNWLGFITQSDGTWNTAGTWLGNIVPTPNSPVTIAATHDVTMDVSADPASIIINATGTLTHNNNSFTLGAINLGPVTVNGTFTLGSACSAANRFRTATLTVNAGGLVQNSAANAIAFNVTGTFTLNGTAAYNHNALGSSANGSATDLPGSTRTFSSTSTVTFQRWAIGTAPAALPPVTWGNLVFNLTTLNGVWNMNGNLTTINGSLSITNTVSGDVELALNTNVNTTVAGTVSIGASGILVLSTGSGNCTLTCVGGFANDGQFAPQTFGTGDGTLVVSGSFANNGFFDNSLGGSFNSWVEFAGAGMTASWATPPTALTQLNLRCNTTGNVNLLGTTFPLETGDQIRMSNSGHFVNGTIQFLGLNTVVYDATVPQTNGVELPNLLGPDNVTINNTGATPTVTLTNSITVSTTLTLTSGYLVLGGFSVTCSFAVVGGSASSYVRTNGTGQFRANVGGLPPNFTFPVGNSSYNPITITNSGTGDLYGVRVTDGSPPSPLNPNKVVNRAWIITEQVAGGSNLQLAAQWNSPSEEALNFAAGTLNRFGRWSGTAWSQVGATQSGSNPFVFTTTLNFTTVGTFALGKDDAFLTGSITYTWIGADDGSWGDPDNWSPAGVPTVLDNVIFNAPGTNVTNFTTPQSVANLTLNGTGVLNLGATASLTVNGSITYANTATANFDCASTFNIASSSAIVIPALQYGNLNCTGGNRTWSNAATTFVCGSFTPGAGIYTVTGSSVDFNATGIQSITGTFNDLIISGNRTTSSVTLLNGGIINCSGTFSPTATFTTGGYVVIGNTFNYNGPNGQSIAAFNYHNLSSTNNDRVLPNGGTVGIGATFTPGTGIYTTTNSTVTFNGIANQTIPLITTAVAGQSYHHVVIEGTGTYVPTRTLFGVTATTFTGNLTINAGDFIQSTATARNLTINGSLNINSLNARFNQHAGNGVCNTTIGGNFNQAGRFDFNTSAGGTGDGFLIISGSMIATAGVVTSTSAGSPAVNPILSFTGASATYNRTAGGNLFTDVFVGAGASLQLLSNMVVGDGDFVVGANSTLNAQGFTVSTSNSGGSADEFRTNSGSLVRTTLPGGISALVAGGVFNPNANTYWQFDGSNQNTGFNTTPVITAVGRIICNVSGTLTHTGSDVTASDRVMLLQGIFNLANQNLTIGSTATFTGSNAFNASNMIVTSGTGALIKSFSTVGSFLWPLGDNTGTAEYSPAHINFTAMSILPGTIGVRVVDDKHPQDASTTDFLSRYWAFSATGLSSYTYNGSFTYLASDINGTEANIRANFWKSSPPGWYQNNSSSASSFDLTTSSLTHVNAPLNNSEVTGRVEQSYYYQTVASGNWGAVSTWEYSTDPAFLAPAGSPAVVIPNSGNSAGITIRNTHNVTLASSISADDLIIQTGGTLTIASGQTLTVQDGAPAVDLSNSGTLVNAGTITPTGNVTHNSGGVYEHAQNGNPIVISTWLAGSTMRVTGSTTGLPGNLSQAFHHVEWNCPGQTGNIALNGLLTSIGGDFNVISTGVPATNNIRLIPNGTTAVVNVGGNVNVTGGYLALINSGSNGAGTGTLNIAGNMNISGGVFDMTGSSTNTAAASIVNLQGDLSVSLTGSIVRSNATPGVFRFARTSGNQNFSSTASGISAGAITWQVGNGTTNTLTLLTDFVMNAAASLNVTANTTLNCATYTVSGGAGGSFNAQASSTLALGSPDGYMALPALSGNIQTLAVRTVNILANVVYNGSVNQNTGTGISTIGSITIANTGSVGNNLVTQSNATVTCSVGFTLNSGTYRPTSTNTLSLSAGGTFTNNGGSMATTASGADGGTLNFIGAGTIAGTNQTTFFNIILNSGAVNNTTTPFINGTLRINGGNLTQAPIYNSGSTLRYNAATYGRFVEWNHIGATGTLGSTPGYPDNVTIAAGTVDVFNGASGEIRACDGDLNISTGSVLNMNAMNARLVVGGDVIISGTLNLGTNIGGDLEILGNWNRTGTFNSNSRQVIFNGSVQQQITGFTTFTFLRIDNPADVLLNNSIVVQNELDLSDGDFILGATTMFLGTANVINGGASSYIVTNSTGMVQRQISNSALTFHVGTSGSYAPATLTQNGTSELMNVRVSNTITNAVNDPTRVVNLQWTLNEGTAGGNNIVAAFQWNTSDQGTSFNTGLPVYQGDWLGSFYGVRTSTVSGANPFVSTSTQHLTGNLSNLAVVVGNLEGLRGCFNTLVAGDWNTGATWEGGLVPPAGSQICINNPITINVANPSSPQSVSVNPGGSLNIAASRTLTIDNGGFLSNNGAVTSLGSGRVIFSGSGSVQGTTASTINHLELNGGTTLTTPPTINGSMTLNAGSFVSAPPVYGASSSLIYNTGGSYGVSNEWTGSGTIAGAGVPNQVIIQNSTTVNMPASTRGMAGAMNIASGVLALNPASGDLVVGGDWTRSSTASFIPNNRAVFFSGSTNQTISVTGGGTETFSYLILNKPGGNLVLSNSPATNVVVDGSAGDVLQLLNVGSLDLNGRQVSLTNNGGSVLVSGGARSITGTAGSIFSINGSKSTGSALGGTLSYGSNVLVVLNNSFDMGNALSTINGELRIATGGFVNTNPPTYATGSTLRYFCGCNYGRGAEWSSTSGFGYPFHVIIEQNATPTTLDLGNGSNALRQMAGDLTLVGAAGLNMTSMTNPFVVLGNVTFPANPAATVTLGATAGGDWLIAGNYSQGAGSVLNTNSREVVFNGALPQSISGTIGTPLAFLKIDNPTSVTLSTPITVTDRVWLNQGVFNLAATVTMSNGSEIRRSSSTAIMNSSPTIGPGVAIDLRYDTSMNTDLEFPACLTCIRDLEVISGTLTMSNNRTFNRDLLLGGDLDLNGTTLTHRGRSASPLASGNIQITSGARVISGTAGSVYDLIGLGGNTPVEYTKVVTNPGSGTLTFGPNVQVNIADGRMNFGTGNPVTINGILQVKLGGSTVSNSCFYGIGSTLSFANTVDYQVTAADLTWANGAIFSGLPGIPFNVTVTDAGTDLTINDNRALRGNLTITNGTLTFAPAFTGNFTIGGNWTRSGASSAFVHNNKPVVFDGSAGQSISCTASGGIETFYDLGISPSAGSISAIGGTDIYVLNALTLTSGNLALSGGSDLRLGTVGNNGLLIGGGAGSYVVTGPTSSFVRYSTTAPGAYFFPIGDALNYTPITVNLNAGTSVNANSQLVGRVTTGAHPNLGTSSNFLNRFWSVDANNFGTAISYGVSYSYIDADVTGIEANLKPYKYNTNGWIAAQGSGAAFEMGSGTVNPGTNTITWSGLVDFSDFTANGNGTPLPITLLSFEAKPAIDAVDLFWSTAAEVNNDYFTIEHSADGLNFESIANVDGAGNSNTIRHYALVHEDPVEGLNYYRLKQTDFDGQFEFSDIRVVKFTRSENGSVLASVFPNPASDGRLFFRAGSETTGNASVLISNALGQVVYSSIISTSENQITPVPVIGLSPGVYLVEVRDGSSVTSHRIIWE